MLSYDNNNSPIESNRDCLQAKEAFYEGNKQPWASRTKVRNANGCYDFGSAKHEEIGYLEVIAMKIERIDDKTVKCFLSNEELEEYDIDYKDFVTRSDKAKEVDIFVYFLIFQKSDHINR